MSAQIGQALGFSVTIAGTTDASLAFAASLGFSELLAGDAVRDAPGFDAVLDASNGSGVPSLAVDVVDPGGRVVFIGLSAQPSLLDSRSLALKDVTAVGVLSGSGGLTGVVELFAQGAVDPRPLVATTVGLDGVSEVLKGSRPAGAGPKLHVDPRIG
nr:zinc-binding dehydrogenase [Kineosporia babensis]